MEAKNNNLSIVLLDDDEASLLHITHLLINNQFATIIATFKNPQKFVHKFSKLHFDILILDIEMPEMSGTEVIEIIGKERCIVNTGSKDRYEEAIKSHPLDILIKPTNEKALSDSLYKARKIIDSASANRKYALFNTANRGGKIWLKYDDMVFITTDKNEPRNKLVIMKNGDRYILANITIDELYVDIPHLLRPNNSTLVSPEVIHKQEHNFLDLTILNEKGQRIMIPISRTFSSKFNHVHHSSV